MAKTSRAGRAPGLVRGDECYTAAELRERLQLGDFCWRRVVKKLRCRFIGQKRFYLGSDVLRFLASRECDRQEGDDAISR